MQQFKDIRPILDFGLNPVYQLNAESFDRFLGMAFCKRPDGKMVGISASPVSVVEFVDIDPILVSGEYYNYIDRKWGTSTLPQTPQEILTDTIYNNTNHFCHKATIPIANLIDMVHFALKNELDNELNIISQERELKLDKEDYDNLLLKMPKVSRIILSTSEKPVSSNREVILIFKRNQSGDFVSYVDGVDRPFVASDSDTSMPNVLLKEGQRYKCAFKSSTSDFHVVDVLEPFAAFKIGTRSSFARKHKINIKTNSVNRSPIKTAYIRSELDEHRVHALSDIPTDHCLLTDEYEGCLDTMPPIHVNAHIFLTCLKSLVLSEATYVEIMIQDHFNKPIMMKPVSGKFEINTMVATLQTDHNASVS